MSQNLRPRLRPSDRRKCDISRFDDEHSVRTVTNLARMLKNSAGIYGDIMSDNTHWNEIVVSSVSIAKIPILT